MTQNAKTRFVPAALLSAVVMIGCGGPTGTTDDDQGSGGAGETGGAAGDGGGTAAGGSAGMDEATAAGGTTNHGGTTASGGTTNHGEPDAKGAVRHTVTISGGGTEVDLQVRLTVDSANTAFWSAVSENGADIRVKSADDVPLPFYLETFDKGAKTASIWLKVPQLTAGTAKVYLVVGGGAAQSRSSGRETFDFFDDFSGDLSQWTVKHFDGAGAAEIIDGWVHLDAKGGDFSRWGGTPDTGSGIFVKLPYEDRYVVETSYRQQGWGNELSHHHSTKIFQVRQTLMPKTPFSALIQGANTFSGFTNMRALVGDADHFLGEKNYDAVKTTALRFRVTRNGATVKFFASGDAGATWGELPYPDTSGAKYAYLGLTNSVPWGWGEFDWARIRKLPSKEPTVTIAPP